MAFSSGVFTSTSGTVNGDGIFVGNKANTAAQLAYEKKMLYGNGISLDPTSAFYVAPKTGLTATVSAGWGIMEGYWFRESTDYDITVTSSVSEQTFYYGVRLDVATGEYTDSHVAARTTFVPATDRVFAIIVIPANAVTLTSGMITDTRNNSTYCGTVNAQREALAALQAEYTEKLEVLESTSIPIHASTHAVGETDALAPEDIGAVSIAAATYTDGEQTQVRTNIRAAKAVSGVADALEAAVVINAQTDNYTAALTDLGKDVWITSESNKTFTIPLQSSVTWVDKSYFFVTRGGSGTLTIAGAGSVTVNAAGGRLKIAEQYGTVMCRRTAENVWLVTGAMSV